MSALKGELTVGEASSYVTGAVEYLEIASSEWKPFDPSVPVAPNIILCWRFRLKKPPESRIEKMAKEEVSLRGWPSRDRSEPYMAEFGKRVVQICASLVKCMAPNTRPIDAGNKLLNLLMGADMPSGSPNVAVSGGCGCSAPSCDACHP